MLTRSDGLCTVFYMTSATFQVGNTYSTGRGDYFWLFTVVARTAKFLTIRDEQGETTRVGVKQSTMSPTEYALPLGNYSQAPVISADRVAA